MYRQKVVHIVSAGGSADASAWVPPGRFAGAHYTFTPDHGTADINISHRGVSLLSKTNAGNNDGVQELAPTAEKLVAGSVHIAVDQVQNADVIDVELFFHF